ncbi:MAG: PD-(D/E)XK nuclease family protein [Flavobacteriaceae bacterium]|nr:PD-(D/E)XK nuclease family protein [Flavobacteriaceae bacterium]
MQSFISKVVEDILRKNISLMQLTIVLPSHRAGLFVKEAFKSQVDKTSFLPKIITIEEFVAEVSELQLANSMQLLFEFYHIYKNNYKKEPDTFDQFYEWATIALNDFNEIDRHLISPNTIFQNLSDLNRIEDWTPKTPLTSNYLTFFDYLFTYYTQLNQQLLEKKIGYQGMLYREAVQNIQNFINNHSQHHIVFAGFNALNKSEEIIFQELLEQNMATVYWDISQEMLESKFKMGHFLKKYKETWNYYKSNPFLWIDENRLLTNHIQSIGIPKKISQLKYVGEILQELPNFNQVALILADENLLQVALNSLPAQVKEVNITMGLPLNLVPAKHLFESLFLIVNPKKQTNKSNAVYYYKDVINFFRQSYLLKLSHKNLQSIDFYFQENIIQRNKTFLSKEEIRQMIDYYFPENASLLNLFFEDSISNVSIFIRAILTLNQELLKVNFGLDREYLLRFNTVFQELEFLNETYKEVISVKILPKLFNQLVKTEQLSFQGEPLNGLQMMGVLESRVLDFKTLIITGINEGILPSGNKDLSFIPFDIKKHFELPTFIERDLIFSYHFFRLLQYAKNTYLIYNSETDSLGASEKSRFLTQLEMLHPQMEQIIISPLVTNHPKQLFEVVKTEEIIDKIKEKLKHGISPSALAIYVRNPMDFYQKYILKIEEHRAVEETMEANTFGSIVHETLKELYEPFINTILSADAIKMMKNKSDDELEKQFEKYFKKTELQTGKNMLMTEVAKKYIDLMLDLDLNSIQNSVEISVSALEKPLSTELHFDELDFPIVLIGNIDRIDFHNHQIRIIDYKTGKVTSADLKISQFDKIRTDEKKSKSLQLLLYAYMFLKQPENIDKQSVICGNISFKNLSDGFIKVNISDIFKGIDNEITLDKLASFMDEIKQLILEILDPNTPFAEKEINFFKG